MVKLSHSRHGRPTALQADLARRVAAAEQAAAQLLQEEAAAGMVKNRSQAKKARQKQRKQARLRQLKLLLGLGAG